MPFELRDYQTKLVNDAEITMQNGGVPCVVAPTGAGKTVIMSELVRRALARAERVVVVAHRQELIVQIVKSLRQHLGAGVGIEVVTAGCTARWNKPVTVGMVPTIARRLKHLTPLIGCTLLQDECFPVGTLIDGVPIESLKPGDLVRCFDHSTGQVVTRPVVRLFKNPAPLAMARVRFTDGTTFSCTMGHPVWVEGKGYTPAATLTPGAIVVRTTTTELNGFSDSLRDVRQPGRHADEIAARQGENPRLGVLLPGMHADLPGLVVVSDDGGHEPETRVSTDESAQPHAQGGSAGEGVHQAAGHGLEADGAGGGTGSH